jgi:hypothetical protein
MSAQQAKVSILTAPVPWIWRLPMAPVSWTLGFLCTKMPYGIKMWQFELEFPSSRIWNSLTVMSAAALAASALVAAWALVALVLRVRFPLWLHILWQILTTIGAAIVPYLWFLQGFENLPPY